MVLEKLVFESKAERRSQMPAKVHCVKVKPDKTDP